MSHTNVRKIIEWPKNVKIQNFNSSTKQIFDLDTHKTCFYITCIQRNI